MALPLFTAPRGGGAGHPVAFPAQVIPEQFQDILFIVHGQNAFVGQPVLRFVWNSF